MMMLLLLLFMFYGSSAEVGNENVRGFAIVVVVDPYDAENADDVLLESFDFYMRSN